MKNKKGKVWSGGVAILLIVLSILLIGCTNKPYELIEEIPYQLSTGVTGTGSMLPILNKNSEVYYIYVNESTELNVNDIIVYEKDDKEIIHSIDYVYSCNNETFYLTRGLNVLHLDTEPVKRNQIKTKAVGILLGGNKK